MSSKFETALKNIFNDEVAYSENGAAMFKTSKSKLLDMNFAISSLRSKSEAKIEKMFSEAYYENKLLAMKFLFMLRDVREGIGERRTFRICLKWLSTTAPDVTKKILNLVSMYGRWDDLFCLISMKEDEVENEVIEIIDSQFTDDVKNMKTEKPISLLSKWMPSINTSSPKTVALAKYLAKKLNLSEKQYRKTLSAMRKYLSVVEQKMSANQWYEIDYEKVPSLANCKYKNAFLRNDEERRRDFLSKLDKGEAKINSSVCFPSDIVHEYIKHVNDVYWNHNLKTDSALEAMWKSLPNVTVNGNVLAVADGSGSMCTPVSSNSRITALEVCNALAIYCAEHCTGPFNNKYITFSSCPQYVNMSKANTLAEKLNIAYRHNECNNTNLEATFDLVLQTVVDNNLKQEDIPTLVILSDMELDMGADFGDSSCSHWGRSSNYSATKTALMEKIRQKWAAHNLVLPRIIWWNICSRTNVIPMQQNPETGIVLCSGYSQSMFKMIASNKTDPYEVLVETLNVERYAPVEEAVKGLI